MKILKPWDRVQIARHPNRPTTLDYISYLFDDFFECHGDRTFGDDEAIVGGIAKFKGLPVTVIGHQRGKDTKENIRRNFGMPHPEGYRKALRLMKQAEKLIVRLFVLLIQKVPILEKQQRNAGKVKRLREICLKWLDLTVPVICIVIGEGGSGGALALRCWQPHLYA